MQIFDKVVTLCFQRLARGAVPRIRSRCNQVHIDTSSPRIRNRRRSVTRKYSPLRFGERSPLFQTRACFHPVRSPLYLRLYADSRRNRIGRRKYRLIARNGTRIPPNNGILRSLPIAMRGTCIYWSPHLLNSSRLSLMNHGCTRLSVDARRADVKARTFPRSSSIVIKRHDYWACWRLLRR